MHLFKVYEINVFGRGRKLKVAAGKVNKFAGLTVSMDIYLSCTEPNFIGAKHIKDGIILQMFSYSVSGSKWPKRSKCTKLYPDYKQNG